MKTYRLKKYQNLLSMDLVNQNELEKNIQYGITDTVRECNCKNLYIGEINSFPKYKWENEKEQLELHGFTPEQFYGSVERYNQDFLTCECGCRFTDMKTIYPVSNGKVYTMFKTNGEPQLDESYIGNEEKSKFWHDLPGKIEQHEDLHSCKINDFYGTVRT